MGIRISVDNINSVNPVVFSEASKLNPEIPEDIDVDLIVHTVLATDVDVTSIVYNLLPKEDFEYFELAQNGKIKLMKPLDYEKRKQLNIEIEGKSLGVDNHGDPIVQSTKLPLSIIVKDVDDHDPQFIPCEGNGGEICLPPVYTAFVNLSRAEMVGVVVDVNPKIEAVDLDTGINANISYTLSESDGYFAIDPSTADIKLSKSLSELNFTSMLLYVVATESTGRSTTIPVQIEIEAKEPPMLPATTVYAVSGVLGSFLLIAIISIIILFVRKKDEKIPFENDDDDELDDERLPSRQNSVEPTESEQKVSLEDETNGPSNFTPNLDDGHGEEQHEESDKKGTSHQKEEFVENRPAEIPRIILSKDSGSSLPAVEI